MSTGYIELPTGALELAFATGSLVVICGIVGGSLAFASLQKSLPHQAGDNYSKNLAVFWACVFCGPFSLLFFGVSFLLGAEFHGLLLPGDKSGWSRTDAEALQRRALRGGDTTVD